MELKLIFDLKLIFKFYEFGHRGIVLLVEGNKEKRKKSIFLQQRFLSHVLEQVQYIFVITEYKHCKNVGPTEIKIDRRLQRL